ncbi:MAG: hypothetical protein WCJ14_00570 [Verrucomicrobiota bacterium]
MPANPMPSISLAAARWYSAPRLWRTLKKVAASTGSQTVFSALTLFHCLNPPSFRS